MKKVLKILLLVLILVPLSGYLVLKYIAEPVRIDDSMSPTIRKGQYLWFERLSYKLRNPQRGDIVVYTDPNAIDEVYFYQQLVGRVIGVPGEVVQLKDGGVFVDGMMLGENYAEKGARPGALHSEFLEEEMYLPQDHYVILADDRVRGRDSRSVGLVSKSHIKGKVFIWY